MLHACMCATQNFLGKDSPYQRFVQDYKCKSNCATLLSAVNPFISYFYRAMYFGAN